MTWDRFNCLVLTFCAVLFPTAVWMDMFLDGESSPLYAAFMALCYASITWQLYASVIRDRWNR